MGIVHTKLGQFYEVPVEVGLYVSRYDIQEPVLVVLGGFGPPMHIDLPTEMVIGSTRVVSPDQARCYRTGWHIVEGKIVASHVGDCEEILMVEVWEDYGDDGHVSYYHIGWRFITSSEFEEAQHATARDSRRTWLTPLVELLSPRGEDDDVQRAAEKQRSERERSWLRQS